jgi:hypothetical protein
MGKSIGALLGNVEASEFYEYPGKKVIIKIKVAINVKNLILSGIHVGNPTDGTCWVDYRYEKLPQVCFKCGMLGHIDKLCRNQALNLDTLAPIGPWIRSTQYCKRKKEEKDKKFYSNPSQARNFGQYSPPVPSDLLEKLAAMRVSKAQDDQPKQPHQTQEYPSYQNMDNTTMEGIQTQQEERFKKAHRLSNSPKDTQTVHSPEATKRDQENQIKRQKLEATLRVGSAKQANPQP